jgi:molybdate transport system ATP-binding protein
MRGFLGRYFAERRGAALVVSHDARDVRELGAEVHVIEDGRIVQSGRPDELAARPATDFVAAFFDV